MRSALPRPAMRRDGDELEVVVLPDNGLEFRNIVVPPGPPCPYLEVSKSGKRAIVAVPDGLQPGDKFNATPARWGGDELEVVPLPGNKQEWRNVVVPPGAVPGGQLEVKKGAEKAIVQVPSGAKVGDRFNAIVGAIPVRQPASDALEVVTLPDGTNEWRNIVVPHGPRGTHMEVAKDEKRAVVAVPDGLQAGCMFNAVPATCADLAIVLLLDGGEEWRNITCPPSTVPGSIIEAKLRDRTAIVRVPDGVKEGEKFNFVKQPGVRYGGEDIEIARLPDGREEWRNIMCPPGERCSHVEVSKDGRQVIVEVPEGVKPGDRFDAVPCETTVRWGGDKLEVVTLPDGREEWRNVVCPPGGAPGGHLEVKKGEKKAIIYVPEGVRVGDVFNVVATNISLESVGDGIEVVTLPDGREEWRNVVCPHGRSDCRRLEVKKDRKKAIVVVPDGIYPGDRFSAIALEPAVQMVAAGPSSENDMRARLQRKLEQRKQADAALKPNREVINREDADEHDKVDSSIASCISTYAQSL